MARGEVRVGCSGWVYQDWRGIVYPEELPQRRWFEHYATLFDTVEINNTFYRLPPPSTVEAWAAQAPAGLRLRGQARPVRVAPHEAARRGDAGCPTTSTGSSGSATTSARRCVQLPPRWKRNVERLDEFLTVAPDAPALGGRAARAVVAARRRVRGARAATAPRCASTTCWPTTRGCARPTGPTSASTGRTRSSAKYHGRYTGRRLWRDRRPPVRVARRRVRRLRVLQQRLRRPRGARTPAGCRDRLTQARR